MFRELCGDTTLENVVLVTNMWDAVSREVGETRERELSSDFFKSAIKAGAQIVRHHNTTKSAHNIIRKIMKNRPVVLQIQRELVDEHKNIVDTAAGEAVNRELNEQIRRHQVELKGLREEMRALKQKDKEARRELEEQARRAREQMERIKKDWDGMAAKYTVEKKRMEAKMKEIEQEREQADADRARLKKTIQDLAGAPAMVPANEYIHYGTFENEWVDYPQYRVPSPPPHPHSSQTPAIIIAYVQALSCLAPHDG